VQENVLMMAEYTDLARFKAIYVVDLCHSLCEVARKKLSSPRFKNVHVVEGDACTFIPDKSHIPADVITYSYSLSSAVFNAIMPMTVLCEDQPAISCSNVHARRRPLREG
jgi:ubiquinone/menaquinone biosynthesis C-methylase UbiE